MTINTMGQVAPLSVLGSAGRKRSQNTLDPVGDQGTAEQDEAGTTKSSAATPPSARARTEPSPRCLEQWAQYMMPLDLADIDRELEAAARSGRNTSKVSMEACRFVMSIFRNDSPKANGGWGSFVWYASKMERNIRYLNKTWPNWRVRLYLDDSVPCPYVHFLRTQLHVEVIHVQHIRKGKHRDYLLPSVRPLVLDDPTVSRFVAFDCHDELTDSQVKDWVNTSHFNNARAGTRAVFTYWYVDMGADNPQGDHCHVNHLAYDASARKRLVGQGGEEGEYEGLQDHLHRHVDAGAWGMIGGQGVFRASSNTLKGFMTHKLLALAKDTRISAGHEEVLMDLTIGKLMRCRRHFVSHRPAFTGCTTKVEASEDEISEWKARHCPNRDRDVNWAEQAGSGVAVDGVVDLVALGLPNKECDLTKAYMERCWGDNLREKVLERAKSTKGQQAQNTPAGQPKGAKRSKRN